MSSPEEIKLYVGSKFARYGINKQRELARLLFEISKRESVPAGSIIEDASRVYPVIKKELLARRYPGSAPASSMKDVYLPAVDIDPANEARVEKSPVISPSVIYYEEGTADSAVLGDFRKHFPGKEFIRIPRLRDHIRGNRYGIRDYNSRRDVFYIVNEKYDFFKKCPCTKNCVCCGYYIFNLYFGCPYECTYCFLQEYTNSPGIIIPANLDAYFGSFRHERGHIRLGTGEFSDSLILDSVTGFSSKIIDFFRNYPEVVFEFKTKGNNIENIIRTEPAPNIVVSWSLNPQKFIERNEFYSADLAGRISAAVRCVEAGYDVGFHFDPVVYGVNWKREYREVVDMIFDSIDADRVRWISLGTFRFSRELKKVIENRFPRSDILDGELLIGFDGKLRYTDDVRAGIYSDMAKWIKHRSSRPYVYLCMESKKVWEASGLKPVFTWK